MGRIFGSKLQPPPDRAGSMSGVPSDLVVRFGSVLSSSLSKRTGAVQLSVVGIAGFDHETGTSDPADALVSERTDDTELYSAPGIIGRPLPESNLNGTIEHMDMIAISTGDGLVPFAYRDLRVKMGGDAPGPGTFAFVGYGGGFHSLTPVAKASDPSGGGTIQTLYCPFDFNAQGVAQKAHTVMLDPTPGNESVMIVHAEGMAITMFDGALVMKNAAGDATITLDADGIKLNGQVQINGGLIVGEPANAVPLLAGAASPGSTKFWVSP